MSKIYTTFLFLNRLGFFERRSAFFSQSQLVSEITGHYKNQVETYPMQVADKISQGKINLLSLFACHRDFLFYK